MRRDVRLYLDDILQSIDIIREHTQGTTEEDFYHNILVQDAVIRRLEIIGEAAKHIPARVREKYPHIPWQDIVGMRNLLAHGYFGVKLRRAWMVVNEDLAVLQEAILKVKGDLS